VLSALLISATSPSTSAKITKMPTAENVDLINVM
ncbi:MAG: hypothetical protein ACI810_002136, partial [Gammaproteobacteria bacterium]